MKTNRCEICYKRYKLPEYESDLRNRICYSCEFIYNSSNLLLESSMDFLRHMSSESAVRSIEDFITRLLAFREIETQSRSKKQQTGADE